MALNIKDPETEQLAAHVAQLAHQTKTAAIRTALQERQQRLIQQTAPPSAKTRLRQFLAQEVWPQIPDSLRGKPISRAEREDILGYGGQGV